MQSVSQGASKFPFEIELAMMRSKKSNKVVGPSIISMANSAPSTVELGGSSVGFATSGRGGLSTVDQGGQIVVAPLTCGSHLIKQDRGRGKPKRYAGGNEDG